MNEPKVALCLTRRLMNGQDSVIIDHKLKIRVTRIKGDAVTLAFIDLKPNEVTEVFREEIYDGPGTTKPSRSKNG